MRGLRVFLVENHEDSVKYMRLYLEHLGHEVTTAEDMATALKLFPGSTWDVLISDIALPGNRRLSPLVCRWRFALF